MSLPSFNFLHLSVSEIQPFPTTRPHKRPPAHANTISENNTLTALKGCGVKSVAELAPLNQNWLNFVYTNLIQRLAQPVF